MGVVGADAGSGGVELSEGDNQQTVFLVSGRGEELRHPLGEEGVGTRRAIRSSFRALAGHTGVAEVGRDKRVVGRRVELAQIGVELVKRDVVERAIAEVEQRMEVDEGVVPRRITAKRRLLGAVGFGLDAGVGFPRLVDHPLHVAVPFEAADGELIRQRRHLDREEAFFEFGAVLLGLGIGRLTADRRDLVGERGVVQQGVAGEQFAFGPQGARQVGHLRRGAKRRVVAGTGERDHEDVLDPAGFGQRFLWWRRLLGRRRWFARHCRGFSRGQGFARRRGGRFGAGRRAGGCSARRR